MRHNSLLFVPWMNISGDASKILAHLFAKLRTAAACLHISVTAPGLSKAIIDIQSRHASQLIVPANDQDLFIRNMACCLEMVSTTNKQIGDLARDK